MTIPVRRADGVSLPTRWVLREADPAAARAIEGTYSLHPVVARTLAGRGWRADEPALQPFIAPQLRDLRSPFELRDMDRAVERTAVALGRKERICVYGDYDVDGVSSTALMVGLLRFLGADPMFFIPHRMNDGYGMNVGRVEEIAAAGATLILTVDTGIGAIEPIRRARELGVDVVVTDHHLDGGELPEAAACVNPNRSDATYEHGRLCGVGVAFKFAHALLKHVGTPDSDAKRFLADQLDLVALGTIADVVPLQGENRVFARFGLDAIVKTKRPGLRALIEIAAFSGNRGVSPELVGFGLGPRLNAAGRTDDATLALRLLLSQSAEEGRAIAKALDEMNRDRRAIEEAILEESLGMAEADRDAHALVVAGPGWHIGVVGIVAARLVERYAVPAIVLAISDDLAKGSARSVPGFDLHEALNSCGEHLVSWGGHASAAGLRLRVGALGDFRRALNDHAGGIFSKLDRTRTVEVDAEVGGGEVTWQLFDDLQRLQPFGEGNPRPTFLMRSVASATPPRVVGKNHLKLRLRTGTHVFDAIAFQQAHRKDLFEHGRADILFRPVENNFNGESKLELEVLDGRASG